MGKFKKGGYSMRCDHGIKSDIDKMQERMIDMDLIIPSKPQRVLNFLGCAIDGSSGHKSKFKANLGYFLRNNSGRIPQIHRLTEIASQRDPDIKKLFFALMDSIRAGYAWRPSPAQEEWVLSVINQSLKIKYEIRD